MSKTGKHKRIAISTGGGDCQGLNAVIRAVVKAARYRYNWEVIGILDGLTGLIDTTKTKKLNISDVRGLLPKGGTIIGTANKGDPLHYPVEIDGEIKYIDMRDKIVNNFHDLLLDALIMVGGDGTQSIAYELYKKGIPVVGVPKTIDNDLSDTDMTFGFSTAVQVAVNAIDRLHSTAESHHRVMIIEVMGRYAGWIALHAGLGGGADIILIPEIPFDMDEIIEKILKRRNLGGRFSVIVVAEGAFPKGGERFVKREATSKYNNEILGGIGHWLSMEIEKQLNLVETRFTVLGYTQRGGTPVAFDRILATRFGTYACELIDKNKFGKLVVLKGQQIESVALKTAIEGVKNVDPNGQIVKTCESINICLGRENKYLY